MSQSSLLLCVAGYLLKARLMDPRMVLLTFLTQKVCVLRVFQGLSFLNHPGQLDVALSHPFLPCPTLLVCMPLIDSRGRWKWKKWSSGVPEQMNDEWGCRFEWTGRQVSTWLVDQEEKKKGGKSGALNRKGITRREEIQISPTHLPLIVAKVMNIKSLTRHPDGIHAHSAPPPPRLPVGGQSWHWTSSPNLSVYLCLSVCVSTHPSICPSWTASCGTHSPPPPPEVRSAGEKYAKNNTNSQASGKWDGYFAAVG